MTRSALLSRLRALDDEAEARVWAGGDHPGWGHLPDDASESEIEARIAFLERIIAEHWWVEAAPPAGGWGT